MNPQQKFLVRRIALGLAGACAVGVLILGALNPGNVALTGTNSADSRLRTRHYKYSLSQVRDVVRAIIPALKTYGRSWQLVTNEEPASRQSSGRSIINAEVPVLVFIDDLQVTLQQVGDTVTVDVHSQSRVGKGDFGENRRHVIQFLTELDRQLGN